MDWVIQFLPLLIVSVILAIIMAWLAGKLGRNRVAWFIFGVIPLVNFVFVWVAVWMCIVSVTSRVKLLEENLRAARA